MFDNPINILVLVILVAGWGLLVYLVISLISPKREKANILEEIGLGDHHLPEEKVLDIAPGTKPKPTNAVAPAIVPAPSVVPAGPHTADGILLSIEVPKENEITPLAAELMFASLHGIYKPELDKVKGGHQDSLSFEIQAQEKAIRFFVWMPKYLQGYVEGQIYAQYPGVNIHEVKDYANPTKLPANIALASAELVLNKEDIFPIKSFDNFEVDPLAAITSTLSKLMEPAQIWVQIIILPENDHWRDRAIHYIADVKSGHTSFAKVLAKGFRGFAGDLVTRTFAGGDAGAAAKHDDKTVVQLAPGVEDALKQIEEKSTKLGFQAKIRIVAADKSVAEAQQKLDLVVGSFKQFNTTNLNGFVAAPISGTPAQIVGAYSSRDFSGHGPVLNVTELASIYHLPSNTVTTPHIVWAGSKKGEPPANLPLVEEIPPEELTNLGVTNFRGTQEVFGIKIPDRRRHIYVIGKSGVGKSTLLQNMTLDDIKEGRGVGVIDPHGDYVDYVLDRVPENRLEDVILFDPSDQQFPIGFNILNVENPKYKVVAASGVVSVFKKIFGESWGPRLEYWLSSAVLALLDYDGATLMMLPRLFTDDAFRMDVIEKINDPVIKARWLNEYNTLDQKQRAETISPILNKVGQFLSSSLVRNIIAQPKNTFNLREVLDNKKILLVKLAKGLIGEDNAALLGAMMVTQIQLAAMSRADELDQEKRADFFLYVDEFQNFATDSFAVILSEARKYRLSLTLAHQFVAQLPETVASAVMGNVGTIVAFRVGADDAASLMREFAPVFDEQDLVNLNVFNIYLKLSIDGLTAGAFSAATLPPDAQTTGNKARLLESSRTKYSKLLKDVVDQVNSQTEAITRGPAPRTSGPIRPAFGGGQRPSAPQFNQPARAPMTNNSQPRPGGAPSRPAANPAPQAPRPFAGNPPAKRGPNVSALKDLLSGIQKKSPVPLAPDQRNELAKTLIDDLNNSGGPSFKDAFAKAQQNVTNTPELPKGEEELEIKPATPNIPIPPAQPHEKEIDPDIKDFIDGQTGTGQ